MFVMDTREMQGRAARLHYQHGMTHHEVGELLGLSRVKVTRLLADARRSGVVEIKIHSASAPFAEVESSLLRYFELDHVWVAPSFENPERTRDSVGMVGAQCLHELVPRSRLVAVGLSSSVAAIMPHLRPAPVADLGVVPLTGSRGGVSRGMNPHELALTLGSAFAARTYHLPAPILASSPEMGSALRSDPGVRETMHLAASADLLVTGIGGMDVESGILTDLLSREETAELTRSGAVGALSGRLFTGAGEAVEGAVDERVVGLTLESIRAIPRRMAVSFGPHKVRALDAALRTGLVNALVTDVDTASALTTGVRTTATRTTGAAAAEQA